MPLLLQIKLIYLHNFVFTANTMVTSKTFALKEGLEFIPFKKQDYVDFAKYLYTHPNSLVKVLQGRVLVLTDPTENGGRVINPGFTRNAFIGAVYQAYIDHRHLILRPDDVWLAITTAFGHFMGAKENAETMREQFVDFEGKLKLTVKDPFARIDTMNFNAMIDCMSDLIEKNTKGDVRAWIEPDFSTTTPKCKTVGQVVLMGVMKHYFEYYLKGMCGLPKITLEGTLDDWKKLREKAQHLASFGIECLTHWSGLLDIVLQKLVDSYDGKLDMEFWSHIIRAEPWGSHPSFITGWINVFMPFTKDGLYRLNDVKPESHDWGKTSHSEVPSSTVEVPVQLKDDEHEYETIFYGGHIVCLYNPDDNSIRPSLDWAIIDITGSKGIPGNRMEYRERSKDYHPEIFAEPAKFSYGG